MAGSTPTMYAASTLEKRIESSFSAKPLVSSTSSSSVLPSSIHQQGAKLLHARRTPRANQEDERHRDEPRREPRALLEWEEPQDLEEQVARAQEYLQYKEDECGKAGRCRRQVVLVDERHQELVAEKDYFDGGDGWSRGRLSLRVWSIMAWRERSRCVRDQDVAIVVFGHVSFVGVVICTSIPTRARAGAGFTSFAPYMNPYDLLPRGGGGGRRWRRPACSGRALPADPMCSPVIEL